MTSPTDVAVDLKEGMTSPTDVASDLKKKTNSPTDVVFAMKEKLIPPTMYATVFQFLATEDRFEHVSVYKSHISDVMLSICIAGKKNNNVWMADYMDYSKTKHYKVASATLAAAMLIDLGDKRLSPCPDLSGEDDTVEENKC